VALKGGTKRYRRLLRTRRILTTYPTYHDPVTYPRIGSKMNIAMHTRIESKLIDAILLFPFTR
jgi:hypothetical protein